MAIQLAVFDMAGTTVADQNNVADAFKKAFSQLGMEIQTGDISPLMGFHKPEAIAIMLRKLDVDPEPELVEEIHEIFEEEMYSFYRYDASVKPLPGAEEIFRYLKNGKVRVSLNTGFSKRIADAIIQRFQWQAMGFIDDYIASNEVEKGRPYPFMINELMKRAGVENVEQVMKVGDTPVDIDEGKNASCKYVIAITTGAASEEELAAKHPTHLIHQLSEIAKILEE